MSDERKIKGLKGRRKTFELFVQNEQGQPADLTGWSIIKLKIAYAAGCLTKYAPKAVGIDEVQSLDLIAADAGSYKLKFGLETSAELAFDDTAAVIQAALNAFFELSGVVVTDTGSNSYSISFEGSDGAREQALLEVVESTLSLAAADVTPTVTETTKGVEANGIDIVEEKCGHLRITLSTDDMALLDVANDQDLDLYVRVGTEDLDIDPEFLKGVLDVEEIVCSDC